jgi:hypothetical protein
MSRRAVTRLAWLLFGTSVLLAAAGTAAGLGNGYSGMEAIRELSVGVLLAVVFPLVGALIASRRPGNPLGWIFCAMVDHTMQPDASRSGCDPGSPTVAAARRLGGARWESAARWQGAARRRAGPGGRVRLMWGRRR